MDDLENRRDIEVLVGAFYRSAFEDHLIGPIFTDVAKMNLDHHLPIVCDFWQTVLFNAGLYDRNAMMIHRALNSRFALTHEHFSQWLSLWTTTVDELFAGPVAERAKRQAALIAGSLQRGIAGESGSSFETISVRPR